MTTWEQILPDDLYHIIQSFLTHEDYWYFLKASRYFCDEIKRKTIYFQLNETYSTKYIENHDHFREKINSLIENPSQQISLYIRTTESLDPFLLDVRVHRIKCVQNIHRTLPNFRNIQMLYLISYIGIRALDNVSHLHQVDLRICDNLEDVSCLRSVPVVGLSGCKRLKDFTGLGKQIKLQLSDCPNLADVKNFSNITNLTLSGCPLLSDISPLRNIPILSISYCPLIKDLTPLLGYHQQLMIKCCNYKLSGYHILRNIPTVSLCDCNIQDVGVFKDAKSVSLHFCHDLVDISQLANVKKVQLSNCFNFIDLTAITMSSKLPVSCLDKINNRIELTIKNFRFLPCQYVSSNVTHLDITLKNDLTSFSLSELNVFQRLQCLRTTAFHDFSTEGLTDIPKLVLCCTDLTDIRGLGRNREVHLRFCYKIRDVTSLKDVPIVVITDCRKIADYSCLAKVPRLKIT